jgi:AcrR family transcriptional regulator
MLPKGSTVDPRVKRTRQLIGRAFEELLREKGFQALTVQDIAEQATVNRATFYAHFEDKYALMDSFIREGFQQCLSSTVPASAALSPGNLRTLIIAVFEYLDPLYGGHVCRTSDKQIVEPLFVTTVQEELYRFILDWLQHTKAVDTHPTHAQAAGLSREKRLETSASVMSWAIFGAGVQWSRGDKGQSAAEIAGEVVAVLAGGLAGSMEAPSPDRYGTERQILALAGR